MIRAVGRLGVPGPVGGEQRGDLVRRRALVAPPGQDPVDRGIVHQATGEVTDAGDAAQPSGVIRQTQPDVAVMSVPGPLRGRALSSASCPSCGAGAGMAAPTGSEPARGSTRGSVTGSVSTVDGDRRGAGAPTRAQDRGIRPDRRWAIRRARMLRGCAARAP